MPPRRELDAITARLDAGEKVSAIAADVGVTERTIRNWLHRAGLPSASSRSRDRRRSRLDDAVWLRDQHLEHSQSASMIAHRLGVSTGEVRAALDRFDISHPPAHPELSAQALHAAFAAGETVSSIARRVGIDRSGVRHRMRRYGITNPHHRPVERPAVLNDADWLRSRYVSDAATITQIAAETGVGPSTIDRALRQAGIDKRPQGRSAPGGFDADWLRDAYVVQRIPVSDIAEQVGFSPMTVRRAFEFHGIPLQAVPEGRPLSQRGTPRRPRRPHPHADQPGGIDPDWLRVEYVQRHRTLRDIAELAGVSETTVHRAINAHDLTRSTVRRSPNALNNASWLRVRYLDEHATAGDIANELHVPVSAVRAALRRSGVRRSG